MKVDWGTTALKSRKATYYDVLLINEYIEKHCHLDAKFIESYFLYFKNKFFCMILLKKRNFTEVSKNLVRYRFENNFV